MRYILGFLAVLALGAFLLIQCGEADLCEGVDCNDDNNCTEDACNWADGTCSNEHRPEGAQCDFDGFSGVCRSGVCEDAGLCRDVDCSDDNDCTDDVCNRADGSCSNPNKVDGADCEIDGNPGRCTDARCVGLCEGVDCSDGNECTIDQCDPSNGSCFNPNEVDGSDCEIDGNAGQCSAGQCVVVCEDVEAIGIQSPLADERFVKGETVSFIAVLTSDYPCDGSELTWTSSLDGPLGTGPRISVKMLSIGTHRVTVAGYGVTATRQVRIYSDLGTFYQAAPAEGEIGRIRSDFESNKISTTGVDEDWTAYEGLIFDQSSTDPNELVIIAKLDVLRHQRFAEPLPFTGGATIYEHLTKYVHALNLYLDCRYNTGGGGQIFFSRNISVWGARFGGTPEDPDACKEPFPNNPLMPYPSPLQLIVHEGRHSEPDDPRHTTCAGFSVAGDATLEGGSGYAQGALYSMWVYKYGLYDPPDIKEDAKSRARILLGRICSLPTHSNPLVQAIVDELLEGYPPSAISKSQRGDPYLEDYACGVSSLEIQP
jgi:hypothetical protein